MVATLLNELAGKGLGRYRSASFEDTEKVSSSRTTTSSSLQEYAQSAYSNITSAYSNIKVPNLSLSLNPQEQEDDLCDASASISGLSKSSVNSKRRRKSMLSPNLLTLMHNPYIGVRGGGRLHHAKPPHESMDAVRKLLYVVEDDGNRMAHSNPPSRRPSMHYEDHSKPPSDDPLIPLTPSRPSVETTTATETSAATPRHRNTGTVYDADYHNKTQQQQQREELLTPFLSHQLATIDSIEQQQSASPQHEESTRNTTLNSRPPISSSHHSPEETASQLTEGTLRAMRDLALDEALALHNSLKYWSDRWERPVFSWFVAGPLVWFGWNAMDNKIGYDHSELVGKRVSQIQAVLARRLSAIGELQHHLLRSGWQRGVAHWGFLGEGGNWAAVDGTDGRMDEDASQQSGDDDEDDDEDDQSQVELDEYACPDEAGIYSEDEATEPFFAEHVVNNATTAVTNATNTIKPLDLHSSKSSHHRKQYRLSRRESEASVGSIGMHIDVPPPPSPFLGTTTSPRKNGAQRRQSSLYYANVRVRKRNGGQIQKDDPALAEWSIDALALIRRQLIRAANGKLPLPFSENWPFEHAAGNASVVDGHNPNGMPVWAGMKYSISNKTPRPRMVTKGSCFSITEEYNEGYNNNNNSNAAVDSNDSQPFPKIGADCLDHQEDLPQFSPKKRSPSSQRSIGSQKERAVVGISNLQLMMNEVSGLLDVMEDIMDIQRARRLEKLKPPPWWKQNWFLVVLGPPTLGYLLYNNLIGKGQTWSWVKYAAEKMMDFAHEHVVLPCVALYDEFTKGPESISDHAARDTATETLKKMIRSWLDETYPEMQEAEKIRLSDAMDITLVEESKESSMKSVYNMNSVIRMSFIEAQFIKKEMMNALVALDEMQASTNFNMNLAAITPFVLLCWAIKKVSKFVFYTAFKWGKSRTETYRSFLDALTEIERLLIMRSNPPQPPYLLTRNNTETDDCVLESDDLGMLMLHIHELRTILWQERRRFSRKALRSVSEDLAELSGERGAVSVRQQLLIVERMNRAYSFLKQGAID